MAMFQQLPPMRCYTPCPLVENSMKSLLVKFCGEFVPNDARRLRRR